MSCEIIQVPQTVETPLTVYKLVKERKIDTHSRYFASEYTPKARGMVKGWHTPTEISRGCVDSDSGLGESLEYRYFQATRSPSGPGIMVYVDPPDNVAYASDALKIWIMGRVPAFTPYFVGFHEAKRILCVQAFEPLCRLLR